jgi:site-specific recombinase XerD
LEDLKETLNQKYIFENDQHELMHNAQVTRRWNALKRETGIECTPHQLRHSYATMLFDAGIDVKTAQTWLGHSDIKTTLDIYTHLSEKRQSQSFEKWFDFVKNTSPK